MTLRSKSTYVTQVLVNRAKRQPKECPYCKSTEHELLGRKKVIQLVYKCRGCELIYRYPQDTANDALTYYSENYHSGLASELPSAEQLTKWLDTGFEGASLDLRAKIEVLKSLDPGARVLDFGASWGYGTHQLRDAGFDAIGYEISSPRATFGRAELNVEIHDDPSFLDSIRDASFDVVFSNHVLEHLGDQLPASFDLFHRVLRPGGVTFHVLPNFAGRTAREGAFWSWIGEAHPIAPTRPFFEKNLETHGFHQVVVGTGPFDEELRDQVGRRDWTGLDRDGDELLAIAFK